jgi:hypothetical protein
MHSKLDQDVTATTATHGSDSDHVYCVTGEFLSQMQTPNSAAMILYDAAKIVLLFSD